MNEYDSILANHLSPSTTCLFSFISILITLSQSHNFIMLFNTSSSNISHFEHLSSSTNTTINSFNELIIPMIITINYSHSSKAHSTLMSNSLIPCTMRKAMLISLILHKVLSFDVIFSTANKHRRMVYFTTKMQSSLTFIMLHSIIHQWTFFFMIFIKHTQLGNSQQMITLLFVILIVSLDRGLLFSLIRYSIFSICV